MFILASQSFVFRVLSHKFFNSSIFHQNVLRFTFITLIFLLFQKGLTFTQIGMTFIFKRYEICKNASAKGVVKHFYLLSMKIIPNASSPCAMYSAEHLPHLQPCPGYTPPLRSVSLRVVCEAACLTATISTLYKRGANHNVSVLNKSGS